MDTYLSKRECAEMLSTTERTVDRWRQTGKLKAVFIGSMTRFKLSDVQAMISSDAPERATLFGRARAPA
jgi:excisionase family DNA binding protein